jgi:hypothetical protein
VAPAVRPGPVVATPAELTGPAGTLMRFGAGVAVGAAVAMGAAPSEEPVNELDGGAPAASGGTDPRLVIGIPPGTTGAGALPGPVTGSDTIEGGITAAEGPFRTALAAATARNISTTAVPVRNGGSNPGGSDPG